MRHMIMWLSAATLLTACSEMSAIEEPEHPTRAQAISFSNYNGWPGEGLRSGAGGPTLFVENDEIIVYATHTEDKNDNDFTSNFMKKQLVKFDGNVWTYSPIKYWPQNGKLTFRGYYPSTVHFDEKNYPDNGLIATGHTCTTGFEPLYAVEAVVNIDNGKLEGAVSADGKLQLGFMPLLNKVNFTAKADKGLFDEVDTDEYTDCRFLLLNFKIWGFHKTSNYMMRQDTWDGPLQLGSGHTNIYQQSDPLDLTEALVKQKVSDAVPGYIYNPSEGYCTESAVVIHEAEDMINIFNNTLHLIPRNILIRGKYLPGFEIQYAVLTNKVDNEGRNVYKESGIITRVISLDEIFDDTGMISSEGHNYQLIKKLININLDFSIDGVTVTRDLEDYTYKPMF
ncbi:MAG: fimbrillin family protein [Bacteroidales bacterium]|nr:fimbrillin family protein [Bacteroidales bacterium]